jgi:hypothetical protein
MSAIVWVTTEKIDLKPEQEAGQFRVSIVKTDGTGAQTKLVDAHELTDEKDKGTGEWIMPPVTFEGLESGDYEVYASRLDTDSVELAAAVYNTFSIAPPPVPAAVRRADVPVTVSVTIK